MLEEMEATSLERLRGLGVVRRTEGTCATCRFHEMTLCRRYPPDSGRWYPVTQNVDWCGEHQVREPKSS